MLWASIPHFKSNSWLDSLRLMVAEFSRSHFSGESWGVAAA